MKKLLSIITLITLISVLLVSCDFGFAAADERLYHDFTPAEKTVLEENLGSLIPFISNDGYYLLGLTGKDDYNHGVRYVVVGASESDVGKYKSLLSTYGEPEVITDGGVITRFEGADLVFDLVAYLDAEGTFRLEVSVISKSLSKPVEPDKDNNTDKDNDGTDNDDDSNNNNNDNNNGTDTDNDSNTGTDNDNNNTDTDNGNGNGNGTDTAEVGYYLSCNNSTDLLYFTGSVTDGRFDGSASKSEAALVFVEETVGGYYLYFVVGNAKTYITIEDESKGASLSSNKSGASLFEWDSTLKTMKVAEDSNNRALGMKADSTYTTFSTYDAQNTSYNFASFKTAAGVEFAPGNGGTSSGGNGSGSNSGGNDNGSTATHEYNDFTSEEKGYFTQYLGTLIPFVPNDEYYLDDYYGTDDYNYKYGFNFYTYGNTAAEFNAYRSAIAAKFDFYEQYTDDYGDTWYTYYDGDIVIDVAYYEYEGEYLIDLYVYSETKSEESPDDSDNSGSSDNTTGEVNADLIKNDGKGLPSDTNGTGTVIVDFKKADKVKDVTDQGYYLDGCPTVGTPGVLVIPVEFSDVTAASRGYSIDKIITAFMGAAGTTDYYSVDEYYQISSYGQLDLDITVLDTWFRPRYNSNYYLNYTIEYYGEEVVVGDQLIIHEALTYLEGLVDLSQFDSDNNGTIDAIVLINTLEVDDGVTMQWAYRYWNIYTDANDEYYEYDGVYANDYLWASYAFIHETTDSDGNAVYTDTSAVNTYTYIHEFGHVLGADDYYDTAGVESPLDGCDVMDAMLGDHNAFTKFNYGWLTSSRLIVTESEVTVTLEDFSKNGDTVIIANNWDEKLGAYQEYFIVVYYMANGLNAGDDAGYFVRNGVVVYHVNASLYKETEDGVTYYDIYNNNTSPTDDYGTKNNLIEFVRSEDDTITYVVGDTLPTVKLSGGESLVYTFVVDEIGTDAATLTFSKAVG